MPVKWKYILWCEDEQKTINVSSNDDTPPSCPNDPSHTVSIINQIEGFGQPALEKIYKGVKIKTKNKNL